MNAILLCIAVTLPGRVTNWEHFPHYGGGNCIIQSGEVILAGTSGGILFAHYSDSEDVLVVDSGWSSPDMLTYDRVSDLTYDQSGNLWVSYGGGGIDMFTPSGQKTHFNQIDGLPLLLGINQTLPDSVIYAATTQGLCIKEFGYFENWDTYSTGGGLPSDNINCIISADSGLYVGTTAGLTFLPQSAPPGSSSSWQLQDVSEVSIVAMTWQADTLWAASVEHLFRKPGSAPWEEVIFPYGTIASITGEGGDVAVGCTNRCYVLQDGNWQEYSNNLDGNALTGLVRVNGKLCGVLANTYSDNRACGSGVALLRENGSWKRTFPNTGPVSNNLRDCTILPDGTLWVTSNANGGSVYAENGWISLIQYLSYRSQCFAVCPAGNGAMISSIGHGVDWLDWNGEEVTATLTITQNDGLINDRVFDASQGDYYTTWFCHRTLIETEPSGVTRLSWVPGDTTAMTFSVIDESSGLPSREVNCIEAVNAKYAWAGTEKGLALIDGDRQVVEAVYKSENGLPSSTVTAIDLARGGDLYIGTASGLAVLSDGLVTEISGVTFPVTSVQCDGFGTVWTGTSDGLKRYYAASQEVEEYTSFNSLLPDCIIYSIAVDMNQGIVWLATDHGLWRGELESQLSGDGSQAAVYPNPFVAGRGEILGVAGIPDEPGEYRIYNLTGDLVYEYSSEGREDFAWDGSLDDGGKAASGVYMLVISRDGKPPLQLKFSLIR
ncbi:hypothetical protein CSA37_05300 [Candidatus Fermentibacteria bacterium]|nr:MAG: hypothetical protein CSA37_05300 [Candidatus Fermentibacteria bacterium]